MSPKLNAIFLMNDEVLPLVYGPEERRALEDFVVFLAPPLSAASLHDYRGELGQVEAIYSGWGVPRLDAARLDRFPACRAVFHAAGTVRTFVTPELWRRGVRLTSAAAANATPVAEYTLAAIIFSLKHAWQRVFELREHRESIRTDATMPGTFGSTVGLLSLSRIGRQVAERLRALDVRVIAYDPVIDVKVARALGVELCGLDQVFQQAEVVSCHMPLLPETTGVLRASHFSSMKPGATFINTARGGVVHEVEMLEVLRRRLDIFAVLDVVQAEPVSAASPLVGRPNVVVTPHIAGSLGPECRRMGRFMIEETRRYLAGEPLQGEVIATQMEFTA